ncbi:MAG: succinate dehydrogenase assembly factor 2 [Alphaproteobacteria bacterium]|nr:succinate dehydrogenase assembly factor 2 [Alphaproteobacteria bacterium]
MSDERLKRLIYRSSYTGTKELDLVLGAFARAHLAELGAAQLDRYEALLGAENPDLYAWVFSREEPPAEHDTDVLRMIHGYARTSRG